VPHPLDVRAENLHVQLATHVTRDYQGLALAPARCMYALPQDSCGCSALNLPVVLDGSLSVKDAQLHAAIERLRFWIPRTLNNRNGPARVTRANRFGDCVLRYLADLTLAGGPALSNILIYADARVANDPYGTKLHFRDWEFLTRIDVRVLRVYAKVLFTLDFTSDLSSRTVRLANPQKLVAM